MIYRFSHIHLIRLAGLFIWLSQTIPLFFNTNWQDSQSWLWLTSHIAFGIGFLILTKNLGHKIPEYDDWILLFAMIAVIFIINWSTNSINGIFYSLIIAILLPWVMPVKQGVFILLLQSLSIGWQLFSGLQVSQEVEESQLESLIFLVFLFGLSAFSYVMSLLGSRQQFAKEELRKLNSELRATQVLLADSSRINERLRISRELHDLIGHHLTALSLNLEVATHITEGKAKGHVKKAQGIARLLLSDVRDVVSSFRNKGNVNFSQAIRELTSGIPRLKIHTIIADNYTIDDPKLAQTMLRCTQELITNCIKHAQANHLWLEFNEENATISIIIKDDGIGHKRNFTEGNGLTGIRERVKQHNGQVKILPQAKGFAIELIFKTG